MIDNSDGDFECFDFGSYLYGYDVIKQNAVKAILKDDKLTKIRVDGKTINFSSQNKAIKEIKNIIDRFFNSNLRIRYN